MEKCADCRQPAKIEVLRTTTGIRTGPRTTKVKLCYQHALEHIERHEKYVRAAEDHIKKLEKQFKSDMKYALKARTAIREQHKKLIEDLKGSNG